MIAYLHDNEINLSVNHNLSIEDAIILRDRLSDLIEENNKLVESNSRDSFQRNMAICEMHKSITCLASELPGEVFDDVQNKWNNLRDML
jgi:hypothetical protein